MRRQAEESGLCADQPLLMLRVAMLLQDAVEAACMCEKAGIDAPLLAKHLLGLVAEAAQGLGVRDGLVRRRLRCAATHEKKISSV